MCFRNERKFLGSVDLVNSYLLSYQRPSFFPPSSLRSVNDRFAQFQANTFNVHFDFPLFQRLALPITRGNTRIPGIKIQDTRILRLMETLLHIGSQIQGWSASDIHKAILKAYGLHENQYTKTQLRYDIRKMKARELIERNGRHYAYRFTNKGIKVSLMFVLFHKRLCGPLSNTLFGRGVDANSIPNNRLEKAYCKADRSIQQIIDLMAA